MFNFNFSIFELRYNEVHCHSLKLYPFLSPEILMVSLNLDYCGRKVTHFLKHPTVTVKIIPSSLKFSSLCRENIAFNYTLIASKIRSVYQLIANQKEWNKTNSLQAVKAEKKHFRRLRCIQNGHVTQKTAKNCRMESWEDCIILLWLGTIYPGCQRLFMGGFRFRSSLKKCRSPVDETKLPDAREKKPLVHTG